MRMTSSSATRLAAPAISVTGRRAVPMLVSGTAAKTM